MPRPTRFRSLRAWAGLSCERLTSSGILDLHQVANLSQHACEDGVVVVLNRAADLAESERAQCSAVLLRLADLATNLRYPNLLHLVSLPSLPVPCTAAPG